MLDVSIGGAREINEKRKPSFENIQFSSNCPYRVVKKDLGLADYAPIHYAKTMEILLIDGRAGIVSIGATQYEVNGKEIFLIPPGVAHFTIFPEGSGDVYIFKMSFEMLAEYLDAKRMFASIGYSLEQIPSRLSEYYNEIFDIILHQMEMNTSDPFLIVDSAMMLLRFLKCCIQTTLPDFNKKSNEKICRIIEWTKEHMLEHISVDDAAEYLHYSKYYFCRFFKENTGVTYLKYLNVLRVNHAIELMKKGYSTTNCCYECGFENISYFIRLFKEVTGYTTVEYRNRMNQNVMSNTDSQ